MIVCVLCSHCLLFPGKMNVENLGGDKGFGKLNFEFENGVVGIQILHSSLFLLNEYVYK